MYVIYFTSRKHFKDVTTWRKELLPSNYSIEEVRDAARLSGCEGFAITDFKNPIKNFEWFV